MNRVFVVGNITRDIYFDRFQINGEERSFLRLILMAERPRSVRGLRIVLWDEKAELYFPYLKKGSELAVIGQFQTRMHNEKIVHEVVSESLLLLRNIDWERGEAIRQRYKLPDPNGTSNSVFVVGEVLEDIHFNWLRRNGDGQNGEYAFLRLWLKCDEYLNGLRVIMFGTLAELAYPYLQPESKIAVDGHLQTRDGETGKHVFEVTAHNMTLLEKINWAAGESALPLRAVSLDELQKVEAIAEIRGD